jgi:hypothetical protein
MFLHLKKFQPQQQARAAGGCYVLLLPSRSKFRQKYGCLFFL